MRPAARAIPLQIDPGIAVSAGCHVLLLALLVWGGLVAPRPLIEMGGGPVVTILVEKTPAPVSGPVMDVPVEPVQRSAPTPSEPADLPVIDDAAPPVMPTTTAPPDIGSLDLPPDRPVIEPPASPVEARAATIDDHPVKKPEIAAPATAASTIEPASSTEPAVASSLGRGPTEVELLGLKLAISDCWDLGAVSTEASRTTVTVLVDMRPDGTASAVTLLSSNGASDLATEVAFKAARKAVFRCAADNRKPLAPERYADWAQIEMTFDPSKMR